MSDPTTSAIDRFFDIVDSGVEKIDHALNRGKHTADQQRVRRQKREVIDTAPVQPAKKSANAAPSTTAAVARKPHFYIVEAIDPKSGDTIFVVTDGGSARTECRTREFAAQILQALEKTP